MQHKKGLWRIAGFFKRAEEEIRGIIESTSFRGKNSKEEFKEGTEYVVAKEYLDMFYDRYGKETVAKFEALFLDEKVQEILNDMVTLECQKITTSSDVEIIKHKHRANGIASIGKLAEKLYSYKIVVKLFENKHGQPEE